MANEEQLKILRSGVEKWNAWRIENLNTSIDLTEADLSWADLSGANLREANLSGANLTGANLTGAYLREADLSKANLRVANLSGANLREANLSGAILSRADLNEADLSKANLYGANFSGAKLSGAILSEARLIGADLSEANLFRAYLRNAILFRTKFTSKKQLNNLRTDLTEEQLAGAIFEDEEEFARKEREKTADEKHEQSKLRITMSGKGSFWTPGDLSLVLMGYQVTYNRLFYLQTTQEKNEIEINRMLEGPCNPPLEGQVRLSHIHSGSLEFILEALVKMSQHAEIVEKCFTLIAGTTATLSLAAAKFLKMRAETRKIVEETKAIALANEGNALKLKAEETRELYSVDKISQQFTSQSATIRENPEPYVRKALHTTFQSMCKANQLNHDDIKAEIIEQESTKEKKT